MSGGGKLWLVCVAILAALAVIGITRSQHESERVGGAVAGNARVRASKAVPVSTGDPGTRFTDWRIADFTPRSRDDGLERYRPGTSDEVIPIVVDSRTCSVGHDPDRIVRSVAVAERPDSVTVSVTIKKPDNRGPQLLCLSTPVERVHLNAPIGDRKLLIGGYDPPLVPTSGSGRLFPLSPSS